MQGDILWLEGIRRGEGARAGGKGANLGDLVAAGFPVPPAFVVSAQACERCVRSLDLGAELAALNGATGETLRAGSQAIAARVRDAELPADLRAAILDAYDALCARCGAEIVCAVRSSATAEDLAGASFAGQHGTYYYVRRGELLRMVKSCWVSLWSEEAASYRATQGIDHAGVLMAVVVQEMIPADVAGVTFTVNPVTGDRDDIVTESSWGMGAAIVDGRVTPDRYVVERATMRLREKRIAEKLHLVSPRLRPAAAARLEEVPYRLRKKPALSDDQAVEIARWALKAEAHFGRAQDIEWAIHDGTFHLLQSRPVTVAGRRPFCRNEGRGKYAIFKPIAENFTDPLTPFTQQVFANGPFALVSIGGRMYADLKLNRWLLPLRLSDAELAKLLLLSREGIEEMPRLDWLRLPLSAALYLALWLLGAQLSARTDDLPADFMDGFRRLAQRVDSDERIDALDTMRELLMTPKLLAPAGDQPMGVNFTSLRHFQWMGLLKMLVRRYAPDLPRDVEALLASGAEDVYSAETGRRIWELSQAARRNEAVKTLLLAHPSDEALDALAAEPQAAPFLEQLRAFLARDGHRAIKEIELRSERWEENPAPVLGMIRNYLLADTDLEGRGRRLEARRHSLLAQVEQRLRQQPLERWLGIRRGLLHYAVGRCKYFMRLRENSRFYWIMGLYMVRRKMLRAERRLLAEGRLKCKDDIFFLYWDEIRSLLAGELGWLDVEERIGERRMEHVRLAKLTPPDTVGIDDAREPEPERQSSGGRVLRGQGASPGRYEGVARVILDPTIDARLEPGEILVAPYTDPAWTPLFLTAGAAVVEVGSFLSHAGTVAREYGLPCVVGVRDGCKRIRTGDRLAVDGERGIVQVLVSEAS